MRIYLDWNASAPLCAAARNAMLPWLDRSANTFSAHREGREAGAAVDHARAQVAALLGWPRDSVVFTSGATEANTTVLSRGRWIGSSVEHPSVRTWLAAELPVDSSGRVDLDRVPDLSGYTGLSVMAANNETGVVQPVAELRALAASAGLLFHVDASQAPGRIPVPEADIVTISAHKLGGPQGVGALLVRPGVKVEPLLRGGPQERARRAGTSNVAAIVGFGAAVADLQTVTPELRDRLEAGLVALGGRVAGAGDRLPNTTCVAFEGWLAEDLVIALDLAGIAVSAGSACASGSAEPSHVLRAMGFRGSAVRFSLGDRTTPAEVDTTLAIVAGLLG